VPLKHSTQTLVLTAKRPGPHTTADTADCFERMRDTVFGGQLPHHRPALLLSHPHVSESEEVEGLGQRLLGIIVPGLGFEAEINHLGFVRM
jgi:hypothetical protein